MSSNCPEKKELKIPCKQPKECDGTHSIIDPDLHFPKDVTSSKVPYSRYPNECPPNQTCMNKCIYRLPNIPSNKFDICNTTLPGLENNNLAPNNFNHQCPSK